MSSNIIRYTALAIATNLISGLGGTVPQYIGWGTGTTDPATRGVTTLYTETYSTTNDSTHNLRVTGTLSRTYY